MLAYDEQSELALRTCGDVKTINAPSTIKNVADQTNLLALNAASKVRTEPSA